MSDQRPPAESETLAVDRALALLAGASDDTRPFPSAAALRLEGELRREQRRLAQRAHRMIAVHAGALAVSLALLAAVWIVERRSFAGASTVAGAGSICAIVAVVVSIWNLFRTADEMAVPS
jgi:hypothetical protein